MGRNKEIIFVISTAGYNKEIIKSCCNLSYYANLRYPEKRLSRRFKKIIKNEIIKDSER